MGKHKISHEIADNGNVHFLSTITSDGFTIICAMLKEGLIDLGSPFDRSGLLTVTTGRLHYVRDDRFYETGQSFRFKKGDPRKFNCLYDTVIVVRVDK